MLHELKVLLVEDNPSDSELVLRELRRGGFDPKWERVDNEPDYLAKLKGDWEIILSDYSLPQFDGPRALSLMQEAGCDLPFIIISGTIGEEIAVSVMRQGATDYLMKDRLTRLPQAVTVALEQKRQRSQAAEAIADRLRVEERLSKFASTAPGAINTFELKTDGVCRFPYASPKIEDVLGFPPSALMEDASCVFARIHPDDLPQLNESIDESIATASTWHGTMRYLHPAKGYIWIESHAVPEVRPDGTALFHGFLLDATERKNAETIRLEQQRRLAAIINSAMDGIITVDEQGKIILFNPAAERMFQCEEQNALGKPIQRFIPSPLPTSSDQPGDLKQPPSIIGIRSDGSPFPIEASVADVAVDGSTLMTITCRDVTERVKAEEARRGLEAQLRQSQKMEAVGTLAGGIAHDFNNILSAVLGNVDLIKVEGFDSPRAEESVDEIRKASLRAKDLVQQILSFSRNQIAERSIISLGAVIGEVASLMRATLPAGLKLVKSVADNAPNVLADSTQIHQVLVNLCTNAWHAMEDQSGRIDLKLSSAVLDEDEARELSGLRPGRYACISVTDTGKGMTPETLDQIFNPFFTTKEPGKGTGLGLSVVHGILQNHDGAIKVTSEVGKGTTFLLYFPAVEAELQAPEKAETVLRYGNGERILFIDDENSLVLMASRVLKHLKYQVEGFTQPEEAIEAFRADPSRYDVIITDMNMPGYSGIKVAEELIKIRPDTNVILSSGYITEDLIGKARRSGIKELLYKPSPLAEISESINRVLGK